MKKQRIAVLLAVAMTTSGIIAPVEASYAAEEVQIQAEEALDLLDASEESAYEAEAVEFFDDSIDSEEINADEEIVEVEEAGAEEENFDAEASSIAVFSDGETAVTGDSEEVIESGYCGAQYAWDEDYENVSYSLYADGRLVFEGTGSIMMDFDNNSKIKSVQVGEGITALGNDFSSSFYGCKNLKSVSLPKSLTSIGAYTFAYCESLIDITLPSGLKGINESTFSCCKSLKSINFPSGLTRIGKSAFSACENLESITLPENLTSIGNYAFSGCKKIKKIILPDKLISENIGESVFSVCSDLRSVTLPKGIKSIRKEMFANCSRLVDITLPASVTEIEEGAFNECSNLTEIELPEGLTTIGDSAFGGSGLLSVSLPEGVTSIGASSFCDTEITNIVLPSGLMNLGESAFAYCDKLEAISIPENITELKKTFYWCYNLKTVSLPNNLQKIEGAFSGCSKLETIHIPDSVSGIGEYSFKYCYNLQDVHFPESLTSIGYEAFYGCEKLSNASLPETLETIDTGAFKNCPALCGVYIPGMNTEIDVKAIGYNSDTEKNEKLVVVGKIGSTAEEYANKTGLIFHNVADTLTYQSSINATCVQAGNVQYWHCDVCGQNFGNAEGTKVLDVTEIAKMKHNKVYVSYKEATCTEVGNRGYYHCESCGRNFYNGANGDDNETEDVMTFPATGHSWQWIEESSSWSSQNVSQGNTKPVNVSVKKVMAYRCWRCREVAQRKNVTNTLKVNVDQITLKCGQSSTVFRVSGDTIASVVSDSSLVKISQIDKTNGTFKVTADSKKTGHTVITITGKTGVSAIVVVFVQKAAVKTKAIKGVKKSVSVVKGKSITLKPTLEPANSPEKISYSSSNKNVATVSSKGVVKAKKIGTAKITIKSGSKKVVVTVKVTKVKTTKITGVPSTKSIKKGKSFQIKAKATPKNTDEKITYKSSNKKVATVTSKGVVKGLKKGTATITVQSGSKKVTCKVTVK